MKILEIIFIVFLIITVNEINSLSKKFCKKETIVNILDLIGIRYEIQESQKTYKEILGNNNTELLARFDLFQNTTEYRLIYNSKNIRLLKIEGNTSQIKQSLSSISCYNNTDFNFFKLIIDSSLNFLLKRNIKISLKSIVLRDGLKEKELESDNYSSNNNDIYKNFRFRESKKAGNSIIENPCYLQGYKNSKKQIIGKGNYSECYILMKELFLKDSTKVVDKIEDKIILGAEFQYLHLFLKFQNITLGGLKNETNKICERKYIDVKLDLSKKIDANQPENKKIIDSICFKSVYSIVLFEDLLKNDDVLLIFENVNDNDNSALLPSQHINLNKKINNLTLFCLIIISITILTLIFFESHITSVIEISFLRQVIKESKESKLKTLELLDSVIDAIPVKYFIFTALLDRVKDLSQKNIFCSYQEYKEFFYDSVKKNPLLKEKVNETLVNRNKMRVSMVISLLLAMLIIIGLVIVVPFIKNSFVINCTLVCGVLLIVFELLKLLTLISSIRYMSSNILTQHDKR